MFLWFGVAAGLVGLLLVIWPGARPQLPAADLCLPAGPLRLRLALVSARAAGRDRSARPEPAWRAVCRPRALPWWRRSSTAAAASRSATAAGRSRAPSCRPAGSSRSPASKVPCCRCGRRRPSARRGPRWSIRLEQFRDQTALGGGFPDPGPAVAGARRCRISAISAARGGFRVARSRGRGLHAGLASGRPPGGHATPASQRRSAGRAARLRLIAPLRDKRAKARYRGTVPNGASPRGAVVTEIRIMFSRYSAFYSPLIATRAAGFLADEGLDATFSIASPDRGAARAPRRRQRAPDPVGAVGASFAPLERGETSEIVHFAQINQRDGFLIAARAPDAGVPLGQARRRPDPGRSRRPAARHVQVRPAPPGRRLGPT